jgi:hypothetical protein
MSTYNFTVRATDNAGAFAERNFSIGLQKTRYDRVVTLSGGSNGNNFAAALRYQGNQPNATGAVRQDPTSVPTCESIVFSGGRFVALGPSRNLYVSKEGVFWNNSLITPPVPAEAVHQNFLVTKFCGGKWMIFGTVRNTTSNVLSAYEWSTTDWLTFTAVGYVTADGTPLNNTSNYGVLSFDYDPASDTTVAFVATGENLNRAIWVRTGTTWRISPTNIAESQANHFFATVLFAGGLWMIANQTNWMYLSRDASYWYTQSLLPTFTPVSFVQYGLSYINGKVVLLRTDGATATAFYTEDAGKTWRAGATLPVPRYTHMALNLPFSTIGDGYFYANSPSSVNFSSATRYTATQLLASGSGSQPYSGQLVGLRPYDPALPSNF